MGSSYLMNLTRITVFPVFSANFCVSLVNLSPCPRLIFVVVEDVKRNPSYSQHQLSFNFCAQVCNLEFKASFSTVNVLCLC